MSSEQLRSVWVRDKRTGAIVGYLLPTGKLVRIANADLLYRRSLIMADAAAAREGDSNATPS